MASLPFQKIPNLPSLSGGSKMQNGLKLNPQGQIKNTNPFAMNPRRFERQQTEQTQRDSLYKGLDKGMQDEFKLYGQGALNRYLELLRLNNPAREDGGTDSGDFLNVVRQRWQEEQAKWQPIQAALDADTLNWYNQADQPFQNAYRQAMIVGDGDIDLEINGQVVRMKGTQAAKEIIKQAREGDAGRLQQFKDYKQQRLQATPFRVTA